MQSYYDTLGVPETASPEEIRQRYREQIKFFHPDTFNVTPEIAEEKTQALNEAYKVLYDPVKRAEYDSYLHAKRQSGEAKKSYVPPEEGVEQEYKVNKEPVRPVRDYREIRREDRKKWISNNIPEIVFYTFLGIMLIFVGITGANKGSEASASAPVQTQELVEEANPLTQQAEIDEPVTLSQDAAKKVTNPDLSKLPHSNEEYKLLHPEEEEPTDEKRTEDISPPHEDFEASENLSGASKIDRDKTQEEAINIPEYDTPMEPPYTGDIIIHEKELPNHDPVQYGSSITVSAPENRSAYLILVDVETSESLLSFFVRAGETATVPAPERICDIYFATGTDWYGRYRMFGDDTVYRKFDEETDFSEYAWTYTLYTVPDGNAEAEYCSASDFQNIA